jgi:NAD(P)-dependent dehydrogenase (short-subunit alcohol dehydrogenase family)
LIVFVTVGFELYFGSNRNIEPVWRPSSGGPWLVGTAWVFGNAPMMFNSFQSVLQAIDERTRKMSKEVVVRLCVLSVILAMLFYLLIVVAAARATPWPVLASSDLAAAAALAHLPWSRVLKSASPAAGRAPDIRVNGVAPGATDTGLSGPRSLHQQDKLLNADEARLAAMSSHIPLGFVSTPDDHVALYVLLASRESSRYMTGSMILSDGGLTAAV